MTFREQLILMFARELLAASLTSSRPFDTIAMSRDAVDLADMVHERAALPVGRDKPEWTGSR